jgi:nitrogen fixation protein FixH
MSMPQPIHESEGLTGQHVFLILSGFFTIVFAVNAYFIWAALSTHSGVVANEPYRKGLRYNERIAAAERQANLGWRDEIMLAPDGRRLVIILRDAAGSPVRGLALVATLGRPATTRDDVALALDEASPGRYEAAIGLDGGGAFIASVEAQDPLRAEAGILYRARKRLWLEH